MSETLIIKNFGPIKDIRLDLKKFNVIIGENATGKSVVAKVLGMCRYFSYIRKNDLVEQPFEDGLHSRGLIEFINEETYIYYECIHYDFEIKRIKKRIPNRDQEDGSYYEDDLELFSSNLKEKSNEFKNLLVELEAIKPKEEGLYDFSLLGWNIPTSFFLNDVSAILDNPFYLPTERSLQSIFSLGKNSIPNISDSLFNQFADLDSIARNFKNDTFIEPLEITYKNIDGRGYFKKEGQHDFLSLYNGASGYKSAIPIVLVVKYYNELRKKKKTFIIEEPELNLFPIIQKKLVNYLTQAGINFGNTILLTTHSPYILTSLNNLMYAYEIGQKYEEEVNEVIKKEYWVNPEEVSTYRLLDNGACKSIISTSKDGTLINAEEIDEVSKCLNKEFDDLINIEIKHISEAD